MKAIWKVLIGAAAVAAVTPYKVEKDEENGKVKVTAATWAATYTKNDQQPVITVSLLPSLSKTGKEECCCEDEACCCGEDDCCCDEEAGDDTDITIEVETAEPEAPQEA